MIGTFHQLLLKPFTITKVLFKFSYFLLFQLFTIKMKSINISYDINEIIWLIIYFKYIQILTNYNINKFEFYLKEQQIFANLKELLALLGARLNFQKLHVCRYRKNVIFIIIKQIFFIFSIILLINFISIDTK